MTYRTVLGPTALLLSLAVPLAVSAATGCGGDSGNGSESTNGDGGILPSGDDTGGDDTDGGGSGTAKTFWYIARDGQSVNVSDLGGTRGFSETLDDTPIGLTIGAGSAWVLLENGTLVRYDAKTNAKVTSFTVAKNPSHIVFAGGAVWVTEDNDGSDCADIDNGPAKLLRVDPATNLVSAQIPITATDSFPCNRFDGLATDGAAVYPLVNNSFGIARVETGTNVVSKRMPLGEGGGFGNGYVTAGGGVVWVHNANAHTISALDPVTLAAKSKTPLTAGYLGERMIASADAVYLDQPGEKLLRVDAKDPTKQIEKTFTDSPDYLFFSGGSLYTIVVPDLSPVIVALDPATLDEKQRTETDLIGGIDALSFVE